MKKITWLFAMILTGCGGKQGVIPSQHDIPGAAIGLPNITIPAAAANFICRDVQTMLAPYGVSPTTNEEKWRQMRIAFGLPDAAGLPPRPRPRTRREALDRAQAREDSLRLAADSGGANNERHDCQGMIRTVDGTEQYMAFVTLWVSSVLERPSFPDRTVVAGITLAGDAYPPLHLKQTRNCVILQGDDPNDNGAQWQAWIINIGANEVCDANHAKGIVYFFKKLFKKAHHLHVYRHRAANPAVAGRWIDTDDQYFIGLQCGLEYFCVIGVDEPGVSPAPNVALWNAGSDHQRLAMKNAAGALVPSGLRGTITVRSGVNTHNLEALNRVVEVARITIEGTNTDALNHYSRKWDLTVVPGTPIPLNLRHTGEDPERGWTAGYGADTADREVKFDAAAHSGEGTVRWRWDPNDEGTWKQCGGGCCPT